MFFTDPRVSPATILDRRCDPPGELIRTFVKGCGGDWEHARRRRARWRVQGHQQGWLWKQAARGKRGGSASHGGGRPRIYARSRGSAPHSRPAPASRTHRGRTPSRTPPRGTAPCATAWLWLSRLAAAAAPPAQGAEATWRDGGDRPTGVGGRRRAARWAAITRARRQPPSRSPEIETLGTGSCRCENLGACDRSRASAGHACRPTRRSPARTRPRHRRCLGAAATSASWPGRGTRCPCRPASDSHGGARRRQARGSDAPGRAPRGRSRSDSPVRTPRC